MEVLEALRNYTHLSGDARRQAMRRDAGVTFCVAGLLAFPALGLMFERLSRKVCVYAISLAFALACALLLAASSPALLHAAQAVAAVAAAGATVASPIYVSEVAEDGVRGALQSVNVLALNAGALLAALAPRVLPARSLAWLALLPTALAVLAFRFWLPETPIYFLRRDAGDAAAASMQWLRGRSAADAAQDLDATRAVLKATRSDAATTTTVFQDFFQKRTLRFCAVVTLLCLVDHFSGFTAAGYKLESLLLQLNPEHGAANDFIQYLVYMVGNVIVILICDRKGRKTALLISTVVCSAALVAGGACFHVMGAGDADAPGDAPAEEPFSAAHGFALAFCLVHVMSYNIGIGVLSAVVIADIFPPKMLNTQLAINGVVSWPFTYALNDLFLGGVGGALGAAGVMWVYAGCCAAGALFIARFLPETKSRPAGSFLMDARDDVALGRFQ